MIWIILLQLAVIIVLYIMATNFKKQIAILIELASRHPGMKTVMEEMGFDVSK